MKRQILFRAKTINEGEWVYGDLLRVGGGCLIYFGSKTETLTPDIPNTSDVAVELMMNEVAPVDPDTLGQYTGVADKNGSRIFEGDIVRYLEANDEPTIKVVKFADGAFSPITEVLWMGDGEFEVLGNIFDSPHLLDEKTSK